VAGAGAMCPVFSGFHLDLELEPMLFHLTLFCSAPTKSVDNTLKGKSALHPCHTEIQTKVLNQVCLPLWVHLLECYKLYSFETENREQEAAKPG
jgi:hypothetical protein